MGTVAEIWRHPIKSHGHERIDAVALREGQAMPWDRRWAVTHARSSFDPGFPRWTPCGEFSIGAKNPALQAINCSSDETSGVLTLTHPDLGSLAFNPDTPADAQRFIEWISPLTASDRPEPVAILKAPVAMTDTDYQTISLINLASHHAVEHFIGHDLSPLRWRGNILFEGFDAWAEHDWIGKRLRVGEAELMVEERIRRCNATMANPESGVKDANTLSALRDGFGHQDCGVYVTVTKSGAVRQGDKIEVL